MMLKYIAVISALLAAAPVQADELLARYVAYIGREDLYNSRGVRLTEPWQILRQDRANFHKFGIAQPGDEWDPFFSDVANREIMERMVMQGYINPRAAQSLVAGGSMVVVQLFGYGTRGNRIDVDVWN